MNPPFDPERKSDGIRPRSKTPAATPRDRFWDTLRAERDSDRGTQLPLAEPTVAPIEPTPRVGGSVADEEITITDFTPSLRPAERGIEMVPVPRRHLWWGIAAGLFVLGIAALLATTTFARLEVGLVPKREALSVPEMLLALDTSVSRPLVEQRVIPAERLEFTRRVGEEFPATGRKTVAERSRGAARIFNRSSSAPQRLVAATRFLTESGILYRLPGPVTIPGAKIEQGAIVPQSVEVELVADQPGEPANLPGPLRLSIPGFRGSPKYEGFYAVAESGFQGGFQGEATVVSADDLTRAQEVVTRRAYDELTHEMNQKVPPEFKTVDGLRQAGISRVEAPKEGIRQDRFRVEAQAQGSVFIFRDRDVARVVQNTLLKDAKPTRELLPDTLMLEYQVAEITPASQKVEVRIRGRADTQTVLREEEFLPFLTGNTNQGIRELLEARSDLASFSLYRFPPWRSSAPTDPNRIRVRIHPAE